MCLVKFIGLDTCTGKECVPVIEPHVQTDFTPNPAYCSGDITSRRGKNKTKRRRWLSSSLRQSSKHDMNNESLAGTSCTNTLIEPVLFCPIEEYAMVEPDRESQPLVDNSTAAAASTHTDQLNQLTQAQPRAESNKNEKRINDEDLYLTCLEQDLMYFEDFDLHDNRCQSMVSKSLKQSDVEEHHSTKYPVATIVNFTTTAFKWTHLEQGMLESHMILKYGSQKQEVAKSLDDGLTVQPTSDFPSEIKGSSQAGDAQIGYTSTSHEFRWTQIEQDMLNNEKTIATISCSSLGQNGELKEPSTLTKKPDELLSAGRTSLNMEGYPQSPFVKLDSTLQYPSPEHSLPVSFDRHTLKNKSQSDQERFGYGRGSSWSSTGYRSYCSCSTSLAVRCSTVPYSVEISPDSCNYYIRDGTVCCLKCRTSVMAQRNHTLSQGVQTLSTQLGKPNESIDVSITRCVSTDAPKMIEPPPTSFRLQTSDVTDDSTTYSSSSVKFKASSTVDLRRKDESWFKRYLAKPSFVRPRFKRLPTTPKYASSLIFDKWTQVDYDIRKLIMSNEDQQRMGDHGLNCTYVEVSFSRNLESVPPPAFMNQSDLQNVFTLLDRQLRNVIASHIIEGNYRDRFYSSFGTSSSGDTMANSSSHPGGKADLESTTATTNGRRTQNRNMSSRLDKLYALNGDNFYARIDSARLLASGRSSSSGFGGAYIFSHGPRNVRPPKPWWDHIASSNNLRDSKIMAAWQAGSSEIIVGGLINHGCHLRIVASSYDERLGSVYAQALLLISEMTRKGIRYEDNRQQQASSLPDGKDQNISMMVRLHLESPELAKLLTCNQEDMSVILGIDALKLGVQLVKKSANVEKTTVMLYTKDNVQYLDSLLLSRIFEGIRRLRTLHRELGHSCGQLKPHIMPVESLSFLVNRIELRSTNYPCYTNNYLTDSLKAQLKTKITSFGGTLAHCIRPNAYYRHSTCPVATDPEAYHVFRDLFIPIIKEINCLTKLHHPEQVNYDLPEDCLCLPLPQTVISYRIRYSRNLKGYGFPTVLSLDDYKQIEAMCQSALLSWTDYGQGRCYSMSTLRDQHPRLYEILSKKHLLTQRRIALLKSRGAFRYWPEGRSIYIAPKIYSFLDLIVHINMEDHLKVICIDWSGKHPFLAHNFVAKMMKWLDSCLEFSHHPRLGFLSPSPENVGTGMQMSAFMRYCSSEANRIRLEKLCDRSQLNLRVQFSNTRVTPSPTLNRILEVATLQSNGLTESKITQKFVNSLNKLMNSEIKYPKSFKLPAIRNVRYLKRDLINQLRPLTNF